MKSVLQFLVEGLIAALVIVSLMGDGRPASDTPQVPPEGGDSGRVICADAPAGAAPAAGSGRLPIVRT